jgi:hypothetical protein
MHDDFLHKAHIKNVTYIHREEISLRCETDSLIFHSPARYFLDILTVYNAASGGRANGSTGDKRSPLRKDLLPCLKLVSPRPLRK